MAITSTLTTSFKKELLEGEHDFRSSGGDAFKLALYTDSATLEFIGLDPNFIATTALGCINLVISPVPCLKRMAALITLMPPPVEPAHAPIKPPDSSKKGTNKGHEE